VTVLSSEFLPEGYLLGPYQIIKKIGQGGFGITYLAQSSGGDQVVIKELYNSDSVQRNIDSTVSVRTENDESAELWEIAKTNFSKECIALKNIRMSGVPALIAQYAKNGTYYMVQEYIDGETLADIAHNINELGKNKNKYIRGLLESCLTILVAVHNQGVLHRDIKTENIMLRRTDESPVLIDFGAVRFQVGGNTFNFDQRVYSVGYSSPEQINMKGEEQGGSSDLYALAATFYALMFSVKTPVCTLERLMGAHVRSFIELTNEYDSDLLRSLDKAYKLRKENRFQTAQAWLDSLAPSSETKQQSNIGKPQYYQKSYWLGTDPTPDDGGECVYLAGQAGSEFVSRNHAVVYVSEDSITIADISTNGTAVYDVKNPDHSVIFLPKSVNGYYQIQYGNEFQLDLAGLFVSSSSFMGSQEGPEKTIKIELERSVLDTFPLESIQPSVPLNDDNLPLATFGERILSHVIKSILNAAIVIGLMLIGSEIILVAEQELSQNNRFSIFTIISSLVFAIAWLAFLLWDPIWWAVSGKDVGKITVGLRVVDMKTQASPSFGQSVVRFLGYIISALTLGAGFFVALSDDRNQTWHDKLAKTIVVKPHTNKDEYNE